MDTQRQAPDAKPTYEVSSNMEIDLKHVIHIDDNGHISYEISDNGMVVLYVNVNDDIDIRIDDGGPKLSLIDLIRHT